MDDKEKNSPELLKELTQLRQRVKELENTEASLREDAEKFHLIFENAFDGISIFEENYEPGKRRLVECNERYAELSGRSRKELLKIGDIERAGLTENLTNKNDVYINKGIKFRGSFTWKRPDKRENIVEYAAVPIKVNGKTLTIGIDREVTEKVGINEALQHEKIVLRTLIDNLPDGIYVKDLEGCKVLANVADLRNMGKQSEAEVLGKNDFEIFPEEIARKFIEDDQQVIKTGKPVLNREEYFIDSNGEKKWLLTTKLPLRDENGDITGLLGIGRDITEMVQTHEVLQKEKNLLRTLIDNLPDLIFFKDTKGHYMLNNSAHLKYLGAKSQEEVLGKTTFDFNPIEIAEQYFQEEMKIIQNGNPLVEKEEMILYPELGERLCHLTNKIPIKDNEGEIIGIVGVSHNITNRKKADEAIKKAYEELEKTNTDLKKANKVKGQFLANMSHEIRTPLNAIIGMTGLLMDTQLNSEQRDFAETIYNSGDILLALINDILDFSKIEAQKIELEKQPFDVRHCVEEALDLIASKAADKDIELVYSIDDGLLTNVVGDVTRVRQILVNLLSNSIKFTEKGEVEVSVSGQLRDHYIYQLHFSVRDTGIGIPLDRQDKVFQSFTQVDASTTRKFGGTGLGLTISKKLSELMGGAMWVESAGIPGEGTTFHFSILTELSVEKRSESDMSALIGKKVLIVDDNQTNRNILDRQTESFQMTPTVAASGNEALSILQQGAIFDLAILDYHMPQMDGVTLAEEIRKLTSGKKLPLILLSSYGYREKKIGFSHFAATLTKPIKLAHLYNALVTVLSKTTTTAVKEHATPVHFDSEIGHQYPLRILLAEDNKINQKVALRFLEKIGYRADVAFNGIEALEALKRQSYDVVLMDVQMPEMDGEQCTLEIRKHLQAGKQPRIIAVTANALSTDRDRYLSIGMDDYIVKPFKLEELVRALVESHIQRKQSEEKHSIKEKV